MTGTSPDIVQYPFGPVQTFRQFSSDQTHIRQLKEIKKCARVEK